MLALQLCGVSHLCNGRSLDGKWKVLRCAHALPGINVKAQKWRYTVSSSPPVREIHRRFFIFHFYAELVKVSGTCGGRQTDAQGLPRGSRRDEETCLGTNKQLIWTDLPPAL